MKALFRAFGALLMAALAPLSVSAAQQVQVVGLFPNAAVLLVDGQRKLVRAGQVGPGGVEVISADARGAVLRVNGVQQRYDLSREYGGAESGYSAPSARSQVSIAKGAGGHFWVVGSVNGQSVQFMVDTGATALAMNDSQARALNIDYRVVGQPMVVSTASGTERAWRVHLDSVKIGSISVLGVEGVVLEGGSPTQALLGMSFLNRVSWREEQGVLILESKL
jgi:aspartyl protease family protein